jgi:hypothetical protein
MTTKKNAEAPERVPQNELTKEQLKDVAGGVRQPNVKPLEYIGSDRATGSVGTSVSGELGKLRPAGGGSGSLHREP